MGRGSQWPRNGDNLPVHDVNVLGERNEAEDGVNVHECGAKLAINDEADGLDALHDAGEVIQSFPKRGCASIGIRRKLANGIWMKGESGGFVAFVRRRGIAQPPVSPVRS